MALLASHPFEVVHVGRADGVANQAEVIDLRRFLAALVVLEEELHVLNVLELDEAKPFCSCYC